MLTRRQFNAALTSSLSAAAVSARAADPALPDAAKIVLGFAPGGTMDALGRRVADKLRGVAAGTVLVDNRSGAAGQIAATLVKDAPADGNTILLQPASLLTVFPYTYAKLPYTLDDFAPVTIGAYTDQGLAVGPMVPANVTTLAQFGAWLRANPSKATFGNPGAGSMSHMIGALAAKHMGVEDARHAPYRGTAPGVQDLLGGQIAAFCGPIGDYLPHRESGRIRILAIAARERSLFLPDVPTLRELGQPLVARDWYGFFLPRRTPTEITARWARTLAVALADKDVIAAMAKLGLEVQSSSSPASFAAQVHQEATEWGQLTKTIGFTMNT